MVDLAGSIKRLVSLLSEEHRKQFVDLERLTSERDSFQSIIPNNDSFYLVPRRSSIERTLSEIQSDFEALNSLNVVIQTNMQKWIATAEATAKRSDELRDLLALWKQNTQAGLHFRGPEFAYSAFKLVGSAPELPTLQKKLASYLADVPEGLKKRASIYLGIAEQEIPEFIDFVSRDIESSQDWTAAIDRIEIRKVQATWSVRDARPSVVVRLGVSLSAEVSFCLIDWAGSRAHFDLEPFYSTSIERYAHFAQGIYGYKQFAYLLGTLDREYERERNYSIYRNSKEAGVGKLCS